MAASDISTGRLVLPPRYLGSVDYYAAIVAAGGGVTATGWRFDKRRKATHRCVIADTRGLLTLTVPIVKPVSLTGARWNDIIVSDHNHWWNLHITAMRSAYGRTPFYEFYEDDFMAIINTSADGRRLTDLDLELDALLRRLMGIGEYPVTEHDGIETAAPADEREAAVVKYYQIRSAELGFLPHLSAVDLLFNMGPESAIVLREMAAGISFPHSS